MYKYTIYNEIWVRFSIKEGDVSYGAFREGNGSPSLDSHDSRGTGMAFDDIRFDYGFEV